MPGGNREELISSVKKLLAMEKDYRVFPGHEEFTTLFYEKKFNRFADFE